MWIQFRKITPGVLIQIRFARGQDQSTQIYLNQVKVLRYLSQIKVLKYLGQIKVLRFLSQVPSLGQEHPPLED